MNLVIDDAIEVKVKSKENPEESRRSLGRLYMCSIARTVLTWRAGQILLKGDNVSLIQQL